MVHVYYHVYAIDGVDSIINEQLALIEKHFDFPYILNVGISIANPNVSSKEVVDKFNKPNQRIRDIRAMGNEFTTLDLIEADAEKFADNDYIFYFHTKGASKQNDANFKNIESWRQAMDYFNIEKVKDVFKIFQKTDFNTYGVLFGRAGRWTIYSGNFWWMKSSYAKTIKTTDVRKGSRFSAEVDYIQNGENWKPYSPYNSEGMNYYITYFKREEYAK